MEMRKLTGKDKEFFSNLPISEIITLHDEFGICFQCNDGTAEYSYTEKIH